MALEIMQIQILLGKEKPLQDKDFPAGFSHYVSEAIKKVFKEKAVEYLAISTSYKANPEVYEGASRSFHLSRINRRV